ncbi:GPI mannosyltransferase 3 [Nematocida sp. AWRm80]|nr:GPI mannosyltransferase 3 [Nematocida sp. AWRm80]
MIQEQCKEISFTREKKVEDKPYERQSFTQNNKISSSVSQSIIRNNNEIKGLSYLAECFKENKILFVFGVFLFRLVNALLLMTHFEPDEYFQSVEVAMNLVLEKRVYTWEWFYGLRSFTFVSIFYIPLLLSNYLCSLVERSISAMGGEYKEGVLFLYIAPYLIKCIGAVIATIGDLSTIGVYKALYNTKGYSTEIVLVTLMNLGLWLYSTRTHVNSFECSMTIYIAYRLLNAITLRDKREKKISYFISLFLSSALVYIRPTSSISLICLWIHSLHKELERFGSAWAYREIKKDREPKSNGIYNTYIYYKTYLQHSRIITIRNMLSPVLALVLSVVVDSIFYQEISCSLYEFIRINMYHKVSHIFGTLSVIYAPLFFLVLLGGYIPMLVLSNVDYKSVEVVVPVVYLFIHSLIPHKEMRFLLPALPYCNIIIAKNLKHILSSVDRPITLVDRTVRTLKSLAFSKKVFAINLLIAIFIGIDHQNITRPLSFLRKECIRTLSYNQQPIFILSVFNPYMLPMNTYLGHKRIIVKSIDNNPNLLPFLSVLNRKTRFNSKEYQLKLLEYDMVTSSFASNILRMIPLDYNYIIINSIYNTEIEENLPQFIKVHESVHQRIPYTQQVSIYKRATTAQ